MRSVFDPLLEALPNFGILLVILLGVGRVASGAADPGDVVRSPTCSRSWPSRSARSAGSWASCRAASSAGTGSCSVLDERGSMAYGTADAPGCGPRRVSTWTTCPSATRTPTSTCCVGIDLGVAPGRGHRRRRRDRQRQEHPHLAARPGSSTRGPAAIRVDGVDIRDLTHDELARAIAVVPQGTFLFDDSVRENVTLGGDFSDEDVWAALRTVQADEFVRALPAGLDARAR